MTKELREKIAVLHTVAPELDDGADEAAAIIRDVEELLGAELGLGVTAESPQFDSVDGVDEDGGPIRIVSTLAYGPVAGRYRLHVRDETGALDPDGGWRRSIGSVRTPWSSCPREVKLRSLAGLPELLGKLADRAAALAEESQTTSRAVAEILGPPEVSPEELRRAIAALSRRPCGNWKAEAAGIADRVRDELKHCRRGAFPWRDARFSVAFGNDGYGSDERARKEVEHLRSLLAGCRMREKAFGTDSAGDASWVMIVETPLFGWEDLRELVWRSWDVTCGEDPDALPPDRAAQTADVALAWGRRASSRPSP